MDWQCSVEFHHDRVERRWDLFGLGLEKGNRAFFWQELSKELGYSTGRDKALDRKFLPAACYVVLSLVAFFWLPPNWHFISYSLATLGLVAIGLGSRYLRSRDWIHIVKTDGSLAFSIPVSMWKKQEKAEFEDYYLSWLGSRG